MSIFSARPVTVTVTGAAGQIGYSLLFRIAAGDLLGPDTHVRLRLLEITPALGAAEGVALELEDGAFPLLSEVDITDSAEAAFDGANVALLVGSRPRTKDMERKDLLQANGAIFVEQGRALSERASDDVRVLVVGNPANTNALIAQRNAPDIPADRFTAMTRLDHNRAKGQLAQRVGASVGDVHRVTIWGNHSLTQVPDLRHALVGHRPAPEVLGPDGATWVADEFTPVVQERGAQIIAARGSSSAASAANAAIDHVHDWVHGTKDGDWTSAGVVSDGSYGVPEGLVSSFPVTFDSGDWTVVPGLDVDGPTRAAIDASVAELVEERDAVESLGLI